MVCTVGLDVAGLLLEAGFANFVLAMNPSGFIAKSIDNLTNEMTSGSSVAFLLSRKPVSASDQGQV